jgi:hypothetical protein
MKTPQWLERLSDSRSNLVAKSKFAVKFDIFAIAMRVTVMRVAIIRNNQ